MNKKHSIIVGLLAGSLFLSANPANAATGNSNTTSEAKTTITYEWKSPYKVINQFNWRNYINSNDSVKANIITKQFVVKKDTTTKKAVVNKTTPAAAKPVQKETEAAKPVEKAPAAPVEEKPATTPTKTAETPAKAPAATTPAPAPAEAKPAQTPAANTADVKVPAAVQQVVDLTNQERAKQGLKALQIDTNLTKSAQAKSQDMKDKNYFSHTSPTYGSPFDQMKTFGVTYKSAGENIAMGQRTPQEVVTGWMNSPGHRENIMNPAYTHIGVGLSDSGFYWTQQFIGK